MTETATRTAAHETPDAAEPANPIVVGDPAVIGVPTFIAGSVALGLVLVGFVPAASVGASIPIIMTATGIGQVIAAVWAASLAQNAVASVFGTFAGFWLSYAALVLGLTHGWFGVAAQDAVRTQELFLATWLSVIVMLTLFTLRLPLVFTVLFVLVDVALALVLLGTTQASSGLTRAGGYAVFAFVLVGAYLFCNALSAATGGRGLPVGRAVLR